MFYFYQLFLEIFRYSGKIQAGHWDSSACCITIIYVGLPLPSMVPSSVRIEFSQHNYVEIECGIQGSCGNKWKMYQFNEPTRKHNDGGLCRHLTI